jgi:hypothetical protein
MSRQDVPYRYATVVSGNGAILPIVESIGRRVTSSIDPKSQRGRRLLSSGRVALWCEALVEGEKLPIVQVLERLKDRVRHEQRPSDLLESIERWQSFYAAPK